jgi:hypothetical protein
MVESMAIANAILRQKAHDEESEVKQVPSYCWLTVLCGKLGHLKKFIFWAFLKRFCVNQACWLDVNVVWSFLFFVACPYMGMQLSYSSKFRVHRVVRCTGGGKSRGRFVKYDKYRVFPTSIFMYVNTLICTLLFTAFVEEFLSKIYVI